MLMGLGQKCLRFRFIIIFCVLPTFVFGILQRKCKNHKFANAEKQATRQSYNFVTILIPYLVFIDLL